MSAFIVVVSTALAACTGTSVPLPSATGATGVEVSVAVSAGAGATLHLPDGASVTVPKGGVTGSGRLVGSVSSGAPAPDAGLVVGEAYEFHLVGTQMSGAFTIVLPAPSAPPVDGDSGPDTALLAFYDQSARAWSPVDSTYDATTRTVTGVTGHLSLWRVFRPDFSFIKKAMSTAMAKIGMTNTAPTLQCAGSDQLAADGFTVGTDHADATIIKSCAGISEGKAQLQIANNRGYAMSVDYPSGWSSTTTGADEVDAAIAAWVATKIAVPASGRAVRILPAGQTITLTKSGKQNPVVRVVPDGQAYLATAFLYGADTLSMVLDGIPGKSAPSRAVLAQAVRALDTSSQCIRQGIDLARTTPTTIAGVSDMFTQTYKLAIGCLQDQWEVAFGVGAGLAAFVAGVVDWAITSVKVLLGGLVGAFDAIKYFGGIQFSVEGPAAKTPAASPAATEVVVVDPFTSSGQLKPGFTVKIMAEFEQTTDYPVDCYGPSSSAVSGVTWDCRPNAAPAHECWAPPTYPGQVVCLDHYAFALTPTTLYVTPATFHAPASGPAGSPGPFQIETSDGSTWYSRIGGGWYAGPGGTEGAYGCVSGPCKQNLSLAVVGDDSGVFNQSSPLWTVRVAVLGPDPSSLPPPTRMTVVKLWEISSPF